MLSALLYVLLSTLFQTVTSEPTSNVFVNPYPGLTKAEARCPESPSDNFYWLLMELHDKTPVCYGCRYLEPYMHTYKDIEDTCRAKHETAIPARIYPDHNLPLMILMGMTHHPAVIGAYYESNPIRNETEPYAINSTDEFVVYLQGNATTVTNLTEWSANSYNKFVICMTHAYPRVMDSYLNKNTLIQSLQPNLTEYTCEGDGWDLQASCNGTPFCYKPIYRNRDPMEIRHRLTELNICGMEEPNSFPASVHCQDEYGYIQFKYPGPLRLGLYLPYRAPWNKFDSWQWADYTPADWIPWNPTEPNKCDNLNEKNVHTRRDQDLNDFDNEGNNLVPVLCKKSAVKKELPLDVKKYSTFDKNGKTCRKEPVTHWNHRCPTNSSLWQIVQSEAGVHCYAFVDAPVPLSTDNFTHELCHVLHPEAKLASFHYDRQFGVLYPLTHHANNIIVGLVPNNETFVWADGTPMNKSFWVPGETPQNISNSVVRIEKANYSPPFSLGCEKRDKSYERPLFKTQKINDIKNGMKVACKIEAEPVLPCAPVPDADGMESLNNTVCKDGWIKQRLCDKVYCYKTLRVANEFQDFVHSVEHDYCYTFHPGSYLASVHCIEEHFFIQNFSPKTLIGLHIPTKLNNDTFDVKNFEWTDGTPVDFVGWNRFSNAETGRQYAPMFPATVADAGKFAQVYNKQNNYNSGWSNVPSGFRQVLCKMKATVTNSF